MEDIRLLQFDISRKLLFWSVPSIVLGLAGLLTPWPVVRGIAIHALAWGAVDGIIALAGIYRVQRQKREHPDEYADVRRSLQLRRILLVNAGLDLVYIAGAITIGVVFRYDRFLIGNAAGIAIQGIFLLFFDLLNARRVPKEIPPWYDRQR